MMMFVLAAMALTLGANDSTPSATLAWLAAKTASPEMSRIEQQIADDTNISLERSNGSINKRRWKNAVEIADCIADVVVEVGTWERGTTSTLSQSAKFNLSQIRWIDRSHGASFKQETIYLVLSSEPGGPKPVRNVDSTTGVRQVDNLSLSYLSAAAADRAAANVKRLQQMCAAR
jgi:hypothetical protein